MQDSHHHVLFALPNLFSRRDAPERSVFGLENLFQALFGVRVAEAHGPAWDFWLVDDQAKNIERLTEIGEDEPATGLGERGAISQQITLAA